MKETTKLKQKEKIAIIRILLISQHLMVLSIITIIIISSYARDSNMLFLLFQILIQQWSLLIKIATIVKLTRKTKTVKRQLMFQYIVVSTVVSTVLSKILLRIVI